MTQSPRGRVPALVLAGLLAGALSACRPESAGAKPDSPGAGTPGNTLIEDRPAPPVSSPGALTGEVARVAGTLAAALDNSTVAVLDLADLRGQATQLGAYVSEQITTELVRSGRGRVLERRQVLQVLEELNLRRADLSNSEVELAGQQLGADILVLGSAAAVGRTVEGNVRAVRVSGGSLVAADRFSAAAPDEILRLSGQAIPPAGSASGSAGGSAAPDGPVTEATVGPVQAVLDECRAAGSVVTCSFTFTSATVDAGLRTDYYNVEARDDGGNAYRASEFTFGSENGSEWQTVLVAREPTPGRMMLTGVPITMTRLTRISVETFIRIGERALDNQAMVFRNIPIQR
jgi:TolB-like protein